MTVGPDVSKHKITVTITSVLNTKLSKTNINEYATLVGKLKSIYL